MKTSRKPSALARRASSVPSSVIATKWSAQRGTDDSRRARKCAASEFGSIVVPDLLASRYNVCSGGVAAARTAAGSVESSMCSAGHPGATPITARRTSGARLEPPMPSSTTCVKPSRRTPEANVRSRSSESAINAGELSQPRRLAIFCWVAGSSLQSDGSRRHKAAAAASTDRRWLVSASARVPGKTRSAS